MRCGAVLLFTLVANVAAAVEADAPGVAAAATGEVSQLTSEGGGMAVETKTVEGETKGTADADEADSAEGATADFDDVAALAGLTNMDDSVEPDGDAPERYLAATPSPTSAPTSASSSTISGAIPQAEMATTTSAVLCAIAGLIYAQ
eukprot:TRINITY_DN82188_c0_g1_i1.p1 TRINITY_DN82188_c0_g1~~TRINITY_DN82188_c0_g1_i1.p1  ORF type:complete len:147 (+),score=30.89 TRINITY_DN82188_c0_g1_i1:70-510(+)